MRKQSLTYVSNFPQPARGKVCVRSLTLVIQTLLLTLPTPFSCLLAPAHLCISVCWFPRAAVAKYQKLGGLEQQQFILTILEARGMVWAGFCSLQKLWGRLSPTSPSFWWPPAIFVRPRLAASSLPSLLHCHRAFFPACLSLHNLLIKT